MACEECKDVRDALIGAIKTLEALLKLKGETKPPEPKKADLSCLSRTPYHTADAVLLADGALMLRIIPDWRSCNSSHPPHEQKIVLTPEETKRLTSFLKDGE